MIKLINAFNVLYCMTNKKDWEGRKRTLLFQSDTYRRILLEERLEDPFYHFTSYSSSTEVYFTFFFTVDFLDMTKGKGLAVTVKVRYQRPGFVVSRFFSTALLGRKISFVIPRNSLFIEARFTSRFHGLSSV